MPQPVNSTNLAIKPPSLYVLNARSIAKPHAVEHLIADLLAHSIQVAIITETHLKKKHALGTEVIQGYELFRRDREGRRGAEWLFTYQPS